MYEIFAEQYLQQLKYFWKISMVRLGLTKKNSNVPSDFPLKSKEFPVLDQPKPKAELMPLHSHPAWIVLP